MNLGAMARRSERVIAHNSPLILTALGVVGTITTAYLTGKASFRGAEILQAEADAQMLNPEIHHIKTRYKVERLWKLYLPALGVGAGTVTCIIFANRIGTRRAAAMASAFLMSERAMEEYRGKVVEQIGKNKEQKVRDEIAQDHATRAMKENPQVIVTGTGDSLCLDQYTGRTFYSTVETLKKAQNDINYQLVSGDGYASLNEFYSKIGKLGAVCVGEEVGWNSDKQMELSFSTALIEDKDGVERPCLVMGFAVAPFPNFYKWG